MANFTVHTRTSPRLPDEFQVDVDPAYQPSDEEKAYLDALQKLLDLLAVDAAADVREKCRESIVKAREQWRAAAVAKARADADLFAAGQLTGAKALEQLRLIEANYRQNRPNIQLDDVKPEDQRFAGEFAVRRTGVTLDAGEHAYLNRLTETIDYLAAEQVRDKGRSFSDAVMAARANERRRAAEMLRRDFGHWRFRQKSETASDNILVVRGSYKALRDRLLQSLFAVNVVRDDDGEADDRQASDRGRGGSARRRVRARQGLAVDLHILVRHDLPPPNDTPSSEKQELFVQLNNACTVIRTVAQQSIDRANSWFRQNITSVDLDADSRARILLDEYIEKLAGIGRVGLEGPHAPLAKLALASLKNEFVAREAGRIKNRYVRRLGWWAGGFALGFLAAYVWIELGGCLATDNKPCTPASWYDAHWWTEHKNFLLAALGAAIGTWVSFSVRRLDLPFEDLAMLEETSLDPPFRILFVVSLTLTACLLFWTGAINIAIGDLKTNAEFFKKVGTIAVLIGMFCGLSERALATAISGRAAAFVKSVGG